MTIDPRIRALFASVFGIDGATLALTDSATTIPDWDSVAHINLILALESEFDLRLDPSEIGELTTVEAIQQRVSHG